MTRRRSHLRGTVFTACGVLWAFSWAQAQFWQWRSWTCSREVRSLAVDSTGIWAATSGGLLYVDARSLEIAKFTNTEGLPTNDLTAVAVDRRGHVWVGHANGYLTDLDPRTHQIRIVKDYGGWQINDLAVKGDSLYVGLSLGVSLYLINRNEVKETYRNLGRRFPVEIAARCLAIVQDTIWVGTDFGIAAADLRSRNLQAPDLWTNITSADGLPSDSVRSLQPFGGRIYAGTRSGLAVREAAKWRVVGFGGEEVVDLAPWRDSLVVVTRWGVGLWKGDGRLLGKPIARCRAAAIDLMGNLWVASEVDGLARFDLHGNSWIVVRPNEPGGNNITDLALDRRGVLWCTTRSGVSSYDGSLWRHYSVRSGHLPTDVTLSVAVDVQNRKWIGTQGYGLVVFTESDTGILVTRYTQEGGKLAGSDTPTYVIVSRVRSDAAGNVWILNKFANNGRAVVAVTPQDEWVYFSTFDGLKSTRTVSITFDAHGRAWVGTEGEGVVVIDYGQSLTDRADDDLSQGLTATEDGLESNLVRSLAADGSGVIWIGTDRGLNFWFEGRVGTRYGLISEDVYCVAVDPQDNKWIGTVGGITLLDQDGYPFRHFTTENSQLIWDHVQAIAFDPETGDAFIGTTNGLSQLSTPYTAPRSDLSKVEVFPNPFVLSEKGAKVSIANLARQSQVRIYASDGRLVRNFLRHEVPGGRVLWDGRNDRGELVASGVYLVVVSTASGMSTVRKLAVVR
ncbi:MAG: hypothetical protein ONB23_12445 [candidate division KSB1 bacterium]|nr:hypothetical protein [candidate division KSB1 bacterium]